MARLIDSCVGFSATGMVRIELAGDGSVEAIEIDPQLPRKGAKAVAEQVAEAVAAANQGLIRKLRKAADAAAREQELNDKLAEIREDYSRVLENCNRTIDMAMRRLKE